MKVAALVLAAGIASIVGCSSGADDPSSPPPLTTPAPDGQSQAATAPDTTTLPSPTTTTMPTATPTSSALTKTPQADGTVLWAKNGDEVVVDTKNGSVTDAIVANIMDIYFQVYGTMALRFDPDAPRRIGIIFDPTYTGVAATHVENKTITFSSTYMDQNPNDLDVITHESFHLVQSYAHYTEPGCPAWAVEGEADYARYRYGMRNAEGGWSLPDPTSSQAPTDSYRVTARFFVWLENQVSPTIMTELHEVLKANTYSDAFWTTKTTKTLDQLWSDYQAAPQILLVSAPHCVAKSAHCGGSDVFGAPDILYQCEGDGTAGEMQKCSAGCVAAACR